MPRVGILGGAFNPPHLGHLVCAQEAQVQLELDRVVLVPVGEAPHREIEDDPGAEARLEMCELAAAGDDRFGVSRIELDRDGPVVHRRHARGAARRGARTTSSSLILGGDQAAALPDWHEPERGARARRRWPRSSAWTGRATRSCVSLRRACAAPTGSRFFDMPRIDDLVQRPCAAARRPGCRSATSCPTRWRTSSSARASTGVEPAAPMSAGTCRRPAGSPEALAERIAEIASDRKATDVRVIDLRGIVSYTDFFVICSGNTERQTKAIHDAIHAGAEEGARACCRAAPRASARPAGSCSTTSTAWSTSSRPRRARFYRLEQLWGEAPARSVG